MRAFLKAICFIAIQVLLSLTAAPSYSFTTSYIYDGLNRLHMVWYDSSNYTVYNYDELGNLLSVEASPRQYKYDPVVINFSRPVFLTYKNLSPPVASLQPARHSSSPLFGYLSPAPFPGSAPVYFYPEDHCVKYGLPFFNICESDVFYPLVSSSSPYLAGYAYSSAIPGYVGLSSGLAAADISNVYGLGPVNNIWLSPSPNSEFICQYGGNYNGSTCQVDIASPITTASPPGGTYNSNQIVSLTCADNGATCNKIYYTLDGSTPTSASQVYTQPLTLWANTTLKFTASDTAGRLETVKTQTYVINNGTKPSSSNIIPIIMMLLND